jgi:hypothetical protein
VWDLLFCDLLIEYALQRQCNVLDDFVDAIAMRCSQVCGMAVFISNTYDSKNLVQEIYDTERSLLVILEETCGNRDGHQIYKLQVFAAESVS